MPTINASEILSALIGGLFLIGLFLAARVLDGRALRAKDATTAQTIYIDGIDKLIERNESQLLEMKDQVTLAQAAAHLAQGEVTKAQAAAGKAIASATREQTLREQADRRILVLQNQVEELKGQVQILQGEVRKLQQENAGLIGGAVGLDPRRALPLPCETQEANDGHSDGTESD